MKKALRTFALMMMVLMLAAFAAACGSDDDGDDDGDSDDGVELSQTYTNTDSGLTITINYPEGYVQSDAEGAISFGNSQEAIDALVNNPDGLALGEGQSVVQVTPIPTQFVGEITANELLASFDEEGQGPANVTFGDIEDIEIDGADSAAKRSAEEGDTTGEVFAVRYADVVLLVIAASDDYDAFDDTVEAMIESVSVVVEEATGDETTE